MQKQILAISPADLVRFWPEIREEVARIEAPDGFIPEDVYAMCKTNQATLFFLMIDEKRVGWMVCRLMLPDLHIWQVHADNGYDVLHVFRDDLMNLARQAGASMLTYGSTRKAWAKVAGDHGFKMRMIVYEAQLDPIPGLAVNESAANESNNSEVAAQ